MAVNPLLQIKALGQSVWLDYIQRDILENGEVAGMIKEDGLAGMTSNPAIFEKAINEHDDYDGAILKLARRGSVESFFLSRIDVLVDKRLDELAGTGAVESAGILRGQAAVASARLTYINTTGTGWKAAVGPCPGRGDGPSGCYGRAPVPKTPLTAISSMSRP